jgi:hypothetical protein
MKKKIDNLKDKIIEETIKVSFMTLIYLFYNKNLYTQKDFLTKLRDSSAILIPYIIYIIIVSFSSFKTKPIIINVKMRNSTVADKEETIIYHHGSSREDSRKVKLTISLKNKSTLWASFASFLFRKCKFELVVSFQPPGDELLCQSCISSEDIEDNNTSFNIDITSLITSKLDYNVPCVKDYPFIVNENMDNPPVQDGKYFIKAKLHVNGEKISFLQRRFVDVNIDLEEGYYLIQFIK